VHRKKDLRALAALGLEVLVLGLVASEVWGMEASEVWGDQVGPLVSIDNSNNLAYLPRLRIHMAHPNNSQSADCHQLRHSKKLIDSKADSLYYLDLLCNMTEIPRETEMSADSHCLVLL
jgi:hypothetical protein